MSPPDRRDEQGGAPIATYPLCSRSQFCRGRKPECPEETLEVRLRSTETQSTYNIGVEVEGVIDVHYASLTSQGVQHRVILGSDQMYCKFNTRRQIPYLQGTMYCFISYTNTLATRKSRVRSLLKKRTRSHSLLALNRASDVPAVHWPSQTREKSSRSFTCGDTFFLNGGNPYKESTAACITSEIKSNCGVLTSCEAGLSNAAERFKLSRILHLGI